jgi:hypothetical protein
MAKLNTNNLNRLAKTKAAIEELAQKSIDLENKTLADFGKTVAANYDFEKKTFSNIAEIESMIAELCELEIVKNKSFKSLPKPQN